MNDMPSIPLDHLDNAEREVAVKIVATRGKNKGKLRASKPEVEWHPIIKDGVATRYKEPELESGKAAYLWRMVAFHVSPVPQHHCLPVMADCDLPGDFNSRKELAKSLNDLADKIVMAIPKQQWQGIIRWGRALGYIG